MITRFYDLCLLPGTSPLPYIRLMKDSLRPGLARSASYQTTIDMRARQLKGRTMSASAKS